MEDCHGDTYDIATTGNAIYIVGHPHSCSGVGGFPETNPRTTYRALAFTKAGDPDAAHRATWSGYGNFVGAAGTVAAACGSPGWTPAPSRARTRPRGPSTATNELRRDGGRVPDGQRQAQQGLVRFAVPDDRAEQAGAAARRQRLHTHRHARAPARPASPGASNWDRDNQQLTYKVLPRRQGRLDADRALDVLEPAEHVVQRHQRARRARTPTR